ncbi:MAG: hypothetical protein HC819_24435 [Cyclobacteriaceae bacterium]|nr:hypothetical protein [Cyclobacteriaceae bacterium]
MAPIIGRERDGLPRDFAAVVGQEAAGAGRGGHHVEQPAGGVLDELLWGLAESMAMAFLGTLLATAAALPLALFGAANVVGSNLLRFSARRVYDGLRGVDPDSTQATIEALVARIRAGASLEAVAREAGFTASPSELRDREAMSGAASFAFAQAAFKAAQGGIVEAVAQFRLTHQDQISQKD